MTSSLFAFSPASRKVSGLSLVLSFCRMNEVASDLLMASCFPHTVEGGGPLDPTPPSVTLSKFQRPSPPRGHLTSKAEFPPGTSHLSKQQLHLPLVQTKASAFLDSRLPFLQCIGRSCWDHLQGVSDPDPHHGPIAITSSLLGDCYRLPHPTLPGIPTSLAGQPFGNVVQPSACHALTAPFTPGAESRCSSGHRAPCTPAITTSSAPSSRFQGPGPLAALQAHPAPAAPEPLCLQLPCPEPVSPHTPWLALSPIRALLRRLIGKPSPGCSTSGRAPASCFLTSQASRWTS